MNVNRIFFTKYLKNYLMEKEILEPIKKLNWAEYFIESRINFFYFSIRFNVRHFKNKF